MKRSQVSRRGFLTTSIAAVAGASALDAAHASEARKPKSPELRAPTRRGMQRQSEDGVVYHPEIHKSDLMVGFPPSRDKRVTIENWHSTTDHLRWLHLNTNTLFKSVPIGRIRSPLWVLPRKMMDPGDLGQVQVLWGLTREDAKRVSVDEWLKQSETDAFLVLHDGYIIAEQYFGKMTPHTRHQLWSASKSVLASAVAPWIEGAKLDTGAPATEYVPDFKRSAFDGATIRHLLDMQAGIRYKAFPPPRELEKMDAPARNQWEFASPAMRRADHEFARSCRAMGIFAKLADEAHGFGIYDFLWTLKKDREHGVYFYYAEPNVMALQLVLERATRTPYVEHLSNLWEEMGAEAIATMMIDDLGTPVGNIGLSVTARDFARWGQMLCDGGRVGSGRIIPGIRDLVGDVVRNPSPDKWTEKSNFWGVSPPNTGYRGFLWTTPVRPGRKPIPCAAGAFHQRCYVDRTRRNVVVKFSSFFDKENSAKDDTAIQSFVEEVLPKLVG